jgi:hypothetical protein
MHLPAILTFSLLSSCVAAKPYYGQYNWTKPVVSVYANYSSSDHKTTLPAVSGAVYPTGTGLPSKTSSHPPAFTGAGYKSSSEILGLLVAVAGGMIMAV